MGKHKKGTTIAERWRDDPAPFAIVDEGPDSEEPAAPVAKSYEELRKFNPFHDALGRFSDKNGFATYSANPKSKAGAMAISRSAAGGHGTTFNSHKESQGENINQNYNWLQGGPGAKVLSAQGQLLGQQPKTPPAPAKPAAPKVNVDANGFADYDSADYHQLHSGKKYFAQQNLDANAKQAVAKYVDPNTEPGTLYSFSQNMNYAAANGTLARDPKHKAVFDTLVKNMHNLGYNVNLTRYDHGEFLDNQLAAAGVTGSRRNMSVAQLKQALVGRTYGENRILSTSYNEFKNAANHSSFTSREVKITYKAKASTQALMPGDGAGGKFGEMLLAPTSGKSNAYKIVDVKLSGNKARAKGMPTSYRTLDQIEVIVEVG